MASRKDVATSTIRIVKYWIEDALKQVGEGRPAEAGVALKRAQEHLTAAKITVEDLVYRPSRKRSRS